MILSMVGTADPSIPITRTAAPASGRPATRAGPGGIPRASATSREQQRPTPRTPPGRSPGSRRAATARRGRCPGGDQADDAADDGHQPHLPQHHAAHARAVGAQRHAQRRTRASAARRCTPARRRARWRPATWRGPRRPRTAMLIIRSRKTFSRTCCSMVRRSSTGRFGSSAVDDPRDRSRAAAPVDPGCCT